jgi:hypothetical protein
MRHLKLKMKTICLLTGLAGGILLCMGNRKQEINFNEIALSNIEALAGGENDAHDYCLGSGAIDCYGEKVELRISGLR